MARNIPYEENHRISENEELQKKCSIHETYSQGEDPWLPCTNEYYYKTKNKTDGLVPWCKQCSIRKSMKWAEENPELYQTLQRNKERNPKRIKRNRQHAKEQKESGYFGEYIQRPEVKARRYHENHRNHDITEQEWIYCKDYFRDEDGDWCCAYCGKKIQDHFRIFKGEVQKIDLHKEHVDDKGSNDLSNCVPSCGDCNSSKWKFDFEGWYKEKDFFTEDRYNKIIKWTTEDYQLYIENKSPYKIIRKRNEGLTTYHYELWELDDKRNYIKCLNIADKKKDLEIILNKLSNTYT